MRKKILQKVKQRDGLKGKETKEEQGQRRQERSEEVQISAERNSSEMKGSHQPREEKILSKGQLGERGRG